MSTDAPLVLADRALEYALEPLATPAAGRTWAARRVKGCAGAGKSSMVAARARQLSAAGHDVLALTFNITAASHLKRLASRWRMAPSASEPTIRHFHGFCGEVIRRRDPSAWEEHFRTFRDSERRWGKPFLDMVAAILDDAPLAAWELYDSVLIDEGQDFDLDTWRFIGDRLVRPGGESWLIADPAQDVYEEARAWTDEAMAGVGVSGPWRRLEGSYRLPSDLRDIAAAFGREYLPALVRGDLPASPDDLVLDVDTSVFRWKTVDRPGDLPGAAVSLLLDIRRASERSDAHPVEPRDVVIQVASHETGCSVVRQLLRHGIPVVHACHLPRGGEATALGRCFVGKEDVEATADIQNRVAVMTVHSCKGLDARAAIVLLESNDPWLAYTAMTRPVRGAGRTYLSVTATTGLFRQFAELRDPAESTDVPF